MNSKHDTDLKTVCLIYTGGTVGMVREAIRLPNGGLDHVLKLPEDPSSFIRIAPELQDIAHIDFVEILNKDSTNINPEDWTLIASTIHALLDQNEVDYAGFVVAHGTDTMHFTASAVAFALGPNLNKPVVFTGAQTDASVLHGDARINLVRAVRVALENIAEVVICFGDFVFRGCRTQKRDERKFNAFESPAYFPLADITERILIHPQAKLRLEQAPEMNFLPDFRADIFQISLIPGLRPAKLIPILEGGGWDGIVLQSYGAGNVPDFKEYGFGSFIERSVKAGVPVIIASQFPANSTMDSSYGPGVRAIEAGAIPTGNMTNAAATAKFAWSIAQVRAWVASGSIPSEKRLPEIGKLMAIPYVGEMDVGRTATRNARRNDV